MSPPPALHEPPGSLNGGLAITIDPPEPPEEPPPDPPPPPLDGEEAKAHAKKQRKALLLFSALNDARQKTRAKMYDRAVIERALRAARRGDLRTLVSLDLKGRTIQELSDEKGASVVHHGARSGKVAILRHLVEVVGLSGSTRSYVGATPAHDAAATGGRDTLQWLLEHTGCELNDCDDSGATVVHLAAR